MYIYISSRDSLTFYPNNTCNHFRAGLARRVTLPSIKYKVALVEYYGVIPQDSYIDINLSIAGDSLVEGTKSSILRRLYSESPDRQLYSPATLLYIPVKQLTFDFLEVAIQTHPSSATIANDHCSMLLHVTKQR